MSLVHFTHVLWTNNLCAQLDPPYGAGSLMKLVFVEAQTLLKERDEQRPSGAWLQNPCKEKMEHFSVLHSNRVPAADVARTYS